MLVTRKHYKGHDIKVYSEPNVWGDCLVVHINGSDYRKAVQLPCSHEQIEMVAEELINDYISDVEADER